MSGWMLAVCAWASPEPVVPEIDQAYVTRVNRNLRGLGLGYDNGLWGREFGQGLKIDVPFGPRVGQFVGMRVRGVMTHPNAAEEGPIGMAGLELFGRGPVMAGLVRVYGGGGAWYGGTLGSSEELGLAFGGHYGLETLLTPRTTFAIEIGGQSPVDGALRSAGASIMGGATFYLGGLGQK
jgi:hypothetical protein